MKKKKVICSLCTCLILSIGVSACTKKTENVTKEPEETETEQKENEVTKDYNLHEMLRSNSALNATTEKITTIQTEHGGPTNQGGYFDGKYYWQSFITMVGWGQTGGEVDNEVTIVKWDMDTNTIVKESEKLRLNHCNDFTFNQKTGKIYVCNATGRKNIVSILNPDTLEVEGEIDLGFEIFSINYNESINQYVVGIAGGQTFRLLDENFKIVGNEEDYFEPTTRTIGYTTQGNCCDDDYIYFILYNPNVITVYDWDGNFVSWIKLDIASSIEPENMSLVDGKIYFCTNGADVYKVDTLVPEE